MSAIDRLLATVRTLHHTTPELSAFAPWPTDLGPQSVRPGRHKARGVLASGGLRATRQTAPVLRALRTAAPVLEWRQTYSEAEVGAKFLKSYGHVELFGPEGHDHSALLRGYLGYWGPGLTHDWHVHEAEEVYFTLAGSAVFSARGAPNVILRPGQARLHRAS
ncbi:MAG: dimethylsulfonioproprionate lyase family protein [Shimia sp.]